MAKTALILLCLALASCTTTQQRLTAASKAKGEAQAQTTLPSLPEACTALVERVYPKLGEKVRWTQKRWEITAENRDQLAKDCGSWWEEYRTRVTK
ncbi:hypothetical protein GOZ96_04660 [Agrobacterium vitis]|uniref:Lipoprotein n=1 Tax=Agrobacterium vitis TaxID=373 RepID=A0A7J4X4I6_AGRVI|nr:hypothetical protein [Agrobacterium vitis]KAA3527036.1 hypothetical protein DXT89_13965 [Agrobacterium vitis]MUZ95880.1 hypothetical protein [Agrobacterium vitis]